MNITPKHTKGSPWFWWPMAAFMMCAAYYQWELVLYPMVWINLTLTFAAVMLIPIFKVTQHTIEHSVPTPIAIGFDIIFFWILFSNGYTGLALATAVQAGLEIALFQILKRRPLPA